MCRSLKEVINLRAEEDGGSWTCHKIEFGWAG